MTTQAITVKNFATKLNGIKKRGDKIGAELQTMVEFAAKHYQQHSDSSLLTKLMNTCEDIHGVNAKHMLFYIHAHVNVQYVTAKNKHGEKIHKFQRIKSDSEAKVEPMDTPWYEWKKELTAAQPVDVADEVKRFIGRMEKRVSEGKVKNPTEANKLLKKLHTAIA